MSLAATAPEVTDFSVLAALAPEDYDDQGTVDAADLVPTFPDSWCLRDDVELMQVPDPEFLIAGVIPRCGVGALIAPPGVGKTTLAADLAVSVATGRDWFGHRVCHRGASVYSAAEDPGGYKIRLRAKKVAERLPLDVPIGVYTFPEAVDMRDAVSVARFSAFLERAFESGDPQRELLIIDTYSASNPGANENSSEDTSLAMTHAQQWRDRLRVTVILIHHTNASGTRERGHSAMKGACDFMITMTPSDDVVHLENTKQRNAATFEPITLKLMPVPDGAGMVFRLASDVLPSNGLTVTQRKVYDVLVETFSAEGATKSEWQRVCADVSERSFHRACKYLAERGHVKQIGSHFRALKGAR